MNSHDNNTVNPETGEVVLGLLERSLDTPEQEFSNWLNQDENKQEMIWAIQALNTDQPGIVRYLLQYGFQGGFKAASND